MNIFKRIFIGVCIGVIIFFIKGCIVNAACSSFTPSLVYYNGSTWNAQNMNPRVIDNGSSAALFRFDASYGTNHFVFTSKVGFDLPSFGPNIDLSPYVRLFNSNGTYSDITNVCSIGVQYINKTPTDGLITYRYFYTIYCDFTGLSSSANSLRIGFNFPGGVYTANGYNSTMFYDTAATCLNFSPSSTDILINNQNANSINEINAINGVNDSLNDNNVSSDTNSQASSIFNTNIDTSHGLSSIVTAPLTLLAKAQESCSPKNFVIFGKTIVLPCGDSLFWSKDFSSYSSIFGSGVSGSQMNTIRDNFRTFWNILFGGAIIFHLLVKLWQVINDTLDPTSDRYESINSAIDTKSMAVDDTRDTDGDDYVPRHSKKNGSLGRHTAQAVALRKSGGS